MSIFKKLRKSEKDSKAAKIPSPEPSLKQLDSRIGLQSYRDFYSLKNYWKAIDRKRSEASYIFFSKYLKQNPENIKLYPKLKNVDITKLSPETADPGFETMAANYLKLFDDVITAVEETPADCSDACSRLIAVGKIHRAKVSTMSATQFQDMEKPFIDTISEILQDRFNDKVENLFRKFFQFCLKYLIEGLNS
ncbi:Globin family and Globin-like domain and Globin, structural domain-containing protein [Strongyloides ratti]|uniref:Globin family and Globin-like domain and Globin, structural domain-containing protein n=1 Tax=Strongyloides ratti TaxID=34506 RepID=A0A090LLH8_STRRB|nr:Globin family and Globin-like domain and Globin, structural domain-containing protein [Strongyloides ratti]CEF69028.1 Globin family and Globin-like domain and Globin, structural domain-containing protein [Strongyloides ratti]